VRAGARRFDACHETVGWGRVGAVAGQPKARKVRTAVRGRKGERRAVREFKRDIFNTAGEAIQAACGADQQMALARPMPSAEILALAMRRVHAAMLFAGREADAVPVEKFWVRYYDAQGNIRTEPNKWFVLEQAMRREAVQLATKMVELGLAERQVALEEAKAVMVAQAVRTAAEAAGLNDEQVHRLGEELRKGLESGAIVETAA
jgi:hypothetical protein